MIVGDIGYRDHMVFTALGDAVNVAARLQDMTKALSCEAVISDEVRVTAGVAADALPQQEVAIRGRNEPMIVRTVADARTLSALVGDVKAPRPDGSRRSRRWAKAHLRRAHHSSRDDVRWWARFRLRSSSYGGQSLCPPCDFAATFARAISPEQTFRKFSRSKRIFSNPLFGAYD